MSDRFDGVQSPLLEETVYDPTKHSKKTLDDIQAPVLEDTYSYNSNASQKSFEGLTAPTLEDTDADYTSSTKKSLSGVEAVQLDDAPAPAPRPVSQFVDPDLERAKAEGKKLAKQQPIEQELTDEEKARNREIHRQMVIAKEAAMAQAGSKLVILCMILGIVSTVCMSVFMKLDFQEGTKELFDKISGMSIYYSVVIVIVSVLSIIRSVGIKKLCSLVFGLNTILMLFPVSTMITSKVDTVVSGVIYAISLIASGYVCFTLSSNENVDKYYKKKEDYFG